MLDFQYLEDAGRDLKDSLIPYCRYFEFVDIHRSAQSVSHSPLIVAQLSAA